MKLIVDEKGLHFLEGEKKLLRNLDRGLKIKLSEERIYLSWIASESKVPFNRIKLNKMQAYQLENACRKRYLNLEIAPEVSVQFKDVITIREVFSMVE